jgi:hypothetical protein
MDIPLPNVHIRRKKKTMRRKRSLTNATKRQEINKEEAL